MERDNGVREKLKRIGMVLCVFLVMGLIGNLVQYMAGLGKEPLPEDAVAETAEPTEPRVWLEPVLIPADQVQNMKIEWVNGTVTLEHGDVDQIRIQETEGKKDLAYTLHEDGLIIQYSKNSMRSLLGIHSKRSKDLTITLPRDWEGGKLELQVASASLNARDLSVKEIEFDGISGVLNLENCQADRVSLQTVSGNVNLTGAVREVECQGVSADCSISVTNVPERVALSGASGKLHLALPQNAGFTLDADAIHKGLETDFEGQETEGSFVSGDGSCLIEIDGASQNVKIQKAA